MGYGLVTVGASLGGMKAISVILAGLDRHFALPVAVVLHRGADSDETLITHLQKTSDRTVLEAEDKLPILPERIYIAPPNYHLLVEGDHFALSTEAPIKYARPSVDVLFESASDAFRNRLIGIILTGASEDGARGLAAIKQRGGLTIVQDKATAESQVMPQSAIAATTESDTLTTSLVLPVEQIGPFLSEISKGTPMDTALANLPPKRGVIRKQEKGPC